MTKTSEDSQRGRGRPGGGRESHAIRATAWAVLAEHGYGGLTFEAAAEAAGCTRATLYRRFRSVVDLVSAVLHETSRKLEPASLAELSPREALTAFVQSAARDSEPSRRCRPAAGTAGCDRKLQGR